MELKNSLVGRVVTELATEFDLSRIVSNWKKKVAVLLSGITILIPTTAQLEHAAVLIQRITRELHPFANNSYVAPVKTVNVILCNLEPPSTFPTMFSLIFSSSSGLYSRA